MTRVACSACFAFFVIAATAGGARSADPCAPTVSQGAGPIGSESAIFPRRSKFGTGYVLTGKILRSLDCKPLEGAVVELWQAGKRGVYLKTGRASVVTRNNGAFRFEGPRPTAYEGRQGHIHLRITAAGYDDVMLTHFPAAGQRTGKLVVVMTSLL